MKRYRRRTRFFILKGLQARYIGLILAFMFVAVVVTGYTVYVTTWVMLGKKLAAVYPQGLLLDIVKKVNTVLVVRLLLLMPFVVIAGLILSHRVAGPIYHIKKFLGILRNGHYGEKLKLREGDELQDLADDINSFVSVLREGKKLQLDRLEKLGKKADALREELAAETGEKKYLIERVDEIRTEIRDIMGSRNGP